MACFDTSVSILFPQAITAEHVWMLFLDLLYRFLVVINLQDILVCAVFSECGD